MSYIFKIPIIWFIIVLFLLDFLVIISMRDLLFDFMIGESNRKKTKKSLCQQGVKEKLFLNYIAKNLKSNIKDFKFYHTIYIAIIITLIPQDILLLLCSMFFQNQAKILFLLFITVKASICIINRLQVDSLLRSKYFFKK